MSSERRGGAVVQAANAVPCVVRNLAVTARCALLDAEAGRGDLALISGESGIGKTRLALELAERGSTCGWQVRVGRSYQSEACLHLCRSWQRCTSSHDPRFEMPFAGGRT